MRREVMQEHTLAKLIKIIKRKLDLKRLIFYLVLLLLLEQSNAKKFFLCNFFQTFAKVCRKTTNQVHVNTTPVQPLTYTNK